MSKVKDKASKRETSNAGLTVTVILFVAVMIAMIANQVMNS